MATEKKYWRVGELAKASGVSVRALHFYEQKKVLVPAGRAGNGYRVYTAADVGRLQQILSLRQLGFSLAEVKECLEGKGFSPRKVVEMHVKRLQEQVAREGRLIGKLEGIAKRLEASRGVSAAMFLKVIKEMNMVESYYTPEQMEEIRKRGEALGAEGIRKAEAEWAEIIALLREYKKTGVPAADARVVALKEKSQGLIRGFTGGDPGIAKSLGKMWKEEKQIQGFDTGEMRELMAYMHGK